MDLAQKRFKIGSFWIVLLIIILGLIWGIWGDRLGIWHSSSPQCCSFRSDRRLRS